MEMGVISGVIPPSSLTPHIRWATVVPPSSETPLLYPLLSNAMTAVLVYASFILIIPIAS